MSQTAESVAEGNPLNWPASTQLVCGCRQDDLDQLEPLATESGTQPIDRVRLIDGVLFEPLL
jgi:hypothetical protein